MSHTHNHNHDHGHGHSHSHGHTGRQHFGKAFAIGIALNVFFVIAEVVYGLRASSSALLADAGHNTSDVLSLAFAWAATRVAGLKPSGKYTYGLRRLTILVSLLNALLLLIAIGFIGWDAIGKLRHPGPVTGGTMMWVAGIGVIINTATALLFMKGQEQDLNIKGAFLHMAADAGVSAGVVLAGLLILTTGLSWIDPIISFAIITVILFGTWGLLRDSVNLALDAVPDKIDVQEVLHYLESIEGVAEVHDLHIWALSTTQTALTAHLVVPDGHTDQFIFDLRRRLHDLFDIDHTTLQIEKTFSDDLYREKCC